jgi:hypothetical protein
MFPSASALRPAFELIVAVRQAERNGLMVYAFGHLKPVTRFAIRRFVRTIMTKCVPNATSMELESDERDRAYARLARPGIILTGGNNGRLEVHTWNRTSESE